MRQSLNLSRPSIRGFTLVELVVTFAVLAILTLLAAPTFTDWIRNTQVRSTADAMQNGLRLAQAEAVRRNRLVVFSLTAGQPALNVAAATNGPNWAIQAAPVTGIDDARLQFIQGGAFGDAVAGVTIAGPASICFNAEGRLVTGSAGLAGVTCATPADGGSIDYDVSRETAKLREGQDRPLRVRVALGGQVRMCDPARALSVTTPDGC